MLPSTIRYKRMLNNEGIYDLYARGHTLSQIAVIVPLPLEDVSEAIDQERSRRGLGIRPPK